MPAPASVAFLLQDEAPDPNLLGFKPPSVFGVHAGLAGTAGGRERAAGEEGKEEGEGGGTKQGEKEGEMEGENAPEGEEDGKAATGEEECEEQDGEGGPAAPFVGFWGTNTREPESGNESAANPEDDASLASVSVNGSFNGYYNGYANGNRRVGRLGRGNCMGGGRGHQGGDGGANPP